MATPQISGVDFIMLPTQNFKRAVDFYENVLGLKRSIQWGEHPGQEFETGNLTIAVYDPTAFGGSFSAHAHPVEFRVDDFEAAHSALTESGVVFQGETIDSGVCKQAFFTDPDGNRLGIHHRYKPREG